MPGETCWSKRSPGETVVVRRRSCEVPGQTVVVEKEVVKTVEVPGRDRRGM